MREINEKTRARLGRIIEEYKEKFPNHLKFVLPGYMVKKYQSLYSIRADLLFIRDAGHELAAIMTIKNDLQDIEKFEGTYETMKTSLWYSLIAFYGKCFTSADKAGKTKLEPSKCFADNPPLLATHERLMRLRHEYVAHRGDNEFDVSATMLLYEIKENDQYGDAILKVMSIREVSPSGADLIEYLQLFDYLLEHVEVRMKQHADTIQKAYWEFLNTLPEEQRVLLVLK